MKINITKSSRELEKISEGDVLVFSDREETIELVNPNTGSLLTRRIIKDEDGKLPHRKQFILYTHITELSPSLTGRIYEGIRRKA